MCDQLHEHAATRSSWPVGSAARWPDFLDELVLDALQQRVDVEIDNYHAMGERRWRG